MSAFPRVRAPGMWLALSQLDAAEMETFDDHQSKALNAEEGGTWAPTSRIILGGDGLQIQDAALYIGNGGGGPGILDITSGSLGGVSSGGTWTAASGSTTNLNGETNFGGHDHHVVSGGWLTFDAGSAGYVKGTLSIGVTTTAGTLTTAVAGTVNHYGNTGNGGGFYFKAASNAFQEATATFELSGDTTLKTGGTLTTDAGSTTTIAGAAVVSGTLATSGSATVTIAAGTTFQSAPLATVTHNGDVTIGGELDVTGTFVQTGTLTKSGSTAYTAQRVGDTTDADGTYGATKDVWLVPALTATREYTLKSTSPTPPEGTMMRFAGPTVGVGDNLYFKREDASTVATFDAAAVAPFVDFVFHSGSWRFAGGKLA